MRAKMQDELCKCKCSKLAGDTYDDCLPEPSIDDTVHCCPNCERPNQFGELCLSCQSEIEAEKP